MILPHKINADIYGRKFCSGCRLHQPLEGGMYKQTRSTKRWTCKICTNRGASAGFNHKLQIAR